MSENDYSFMRTGFSQDYATEQANQELENIGVMFTIFAEDAIKLAEVYSKHSKRNVIATEDISRAFKVRAFHGTEFWAMTNVQEKIEEVKKWIREEEENEMSDDENYEEDEDLLGFEKLDTVPDEEMENYTESVCPCIVCRYMNTVTQKWPGWKPDNVQDTILKNAIDQKF